MYCVTRFILVHICILFDGCYLTRFLWINLFVLLTSDSIYVIPSFFADKWQIFRVSSRRTIADLPLPLNPLRLTRLIITS